MSMLKNDRVTLAMILDEVKARGLRVELDDMGVPRLRGPREMITSTLLDVLRLRRSAVIAHLGGAPKSVEWLKTDGTIVPDENPPHEWPPQGCYWERRNGGPWVAIPGRIPLCQQMPRSDFYGCHAKPDCTGCVLARGEDGLHDMV